MEDLGKQGFVMVAPYNKDSEHIAIKLLRSYVFSSVFINTIMYWSMAIAWSAIVNYLIVYDVVLYEAISDFLNNSFLIGKIFDVVLLFGAFFIVVNYQSGDSSYKTSWIKFESVTNNINTVTNEISVGISNKTYREREHIYQLYKLLSKLPLICYYMHAKEFISNFQLWNILMELLYRSTSLIIPLSWVVSTDATILNKVKFPSLDNFDREFNKALNEFIAHDTRGLEKNDLAFEFVIFKILKIIDKNMGFDIKHITSFKNLFRGIAADNGNIESSINSGRPKPQAEISFIILIFYISIIPWFLMAIIPFEWKVLNVFVISPLLSYIAGGIVVAGDSLRNIFTFRGVQKAENFKKMALDSSEKVMVFYRSISVGEEEY